MTGQSLFGKTINNEYSWLKRPGYLVLNASNAEGELLAYVESLQKMIPVWNLNIRWGLLIWDSDKELFVSPSITEDFLADRINMVIAENQEENPFLIALQQEQEQEYEELRGCACGNTKKNATTICNQNYNNIQNYFYQAYAISPAGALVSTTLYWVSYVREGGQWDYKAHWPAGIYCFRVNGTEGGYHKTAEWFGNYNYGFTGKFLFSLETLHAGSYVVSGFDPNDVTTDWPAIDLGYSHAP